MKCKATAAAWLGDRPLKIKGKLVEDLAHFEYHPGLELWSYRKTMAAQQALAQAERRIERYGVG